jgi:DUF4097 and DUF4098 domain-containing protein YvlB
MHAIRVSVCLAAASLLGATWGQGVSKDAPGTASVTVRGLVALSTSVGDISVQTWASPTVRWVAHERAVSPGDLARISVDVTKDGGDLTLNAIPFTGCDRCSIDLSVWVPPSVAVTASSGHGDITISGVENTVIARTARGDIQVASSDGDVVAVTQVGDVSARLRSVSDTRRISLQTVMGDVQLALPRHAAITLTAATAVGDIESAFGSATAHPPGYALTAKTGDGSIQIKLSTHTGDVEVSAL